MKTATQATWTPAIGDLCWFTKSMATVRVIELPDPEARDYKGLFSVERVDSGKRMVVPVSGLAPYPDHP